MRFKVRGGYVVTISTPKEVLRNGQTITDVQVQQFYEGDEMDLSIADATNHAARIEAVDKDAAKFMDSMVAVLPTPAPAIGSADFQAAVAASVAQALAGLNVNKA